MGIGGGIGDSYRDYRQDDQIREERYQLEQARMKNAELEQRLQQLEQGKVAPLPQAAPAVQ